VLRRGREEADPMQSRGRRKRETTEGATAVTGGGAAGEVPVHEAHAAVVQPEAAVQPEQKSGFALGQPIPAGDVLANMAPTFAKDARRQQESLQRRLADQELLAELAEGKFTGRLYERFENELAGYAMAVLCGWMHSGYIFNLAAARGFTLNPSEKELDELFRKSDVREELAIMTVALALPRFREHALVDGGWRFDGGASLSTYFMGACLYVFPNELRKRRAQRTRWHRQDHGDPQLAAPRNDKINDPGVITVGTMRVLSDLARTDPRTRAIVALTVDGYSQEEIVELLGETSIRAVEGVLHRWRKKERGDLSGAGGVDG
jgi:DNA-directed RNA polymerase specialized sigma24 family protein